MQQASLLPYGVLPVDRLLSFFFSSMSDWWSWRPLMPQGVGRQYYGCWSSQGDMGEPQFSQVLLFMVWTCCFWVKINCEVLWTSGMGEKELDNFLGWVGKDALVFPFLKPPCVSPGSQERSWWKGYYMSIKETGKRQRKCSEYGRGGRKWVCVD